MKNYTGILAALLALAVARDVLTEEWPPLESERLSIVVARGEIDIWDDYPHGIVMSPGRTVATTLPGGRYRVVDIEVVPSIILGDTYFIRILSIDDPDGIPCGTGVDECWAYQGRRRSGLPPNFAPEGHAILAINGSSFANSEDPCLKRPPSSYIENSWNVTLNAGNLAPREGLLDVLGVLGTRGFTTEFQKPFDHYPHERPFYLYFAPSAYDRAEEADEAKERVFSVFNSTPGIFIECIGSAGPEN